jgi:hypothetical protein
LIGKSAGANGGSNAPVTIGLTQNRAFDFVRVGKRFERYAGHPQNRFKGKRCLTSVNWRWNAVVAITDCSGGIFVRGRERRKLIVPPTA